MDAPREKIAELQTEGFCVLRGHFPAPPIHACREAFLPVMQEYLETHRENPNRGPHRHFLPMPFHPPCFAPEFFFDPVVLHIVRGMMGHRVVADQWGCDVALRGSQYQTAHVDYQRPLFEELPDLALPPYGLVVSFGLAGITAVDGPIEIAPGTHRMPRAEALPVAQFRPVLLSVGDVLVRHPWAVHRGTPNTSDTPRALVSIRYVRRWYVDDSRDTNAIPRAVWESLSEEQRGLLRFRLAAG